MNDTKNNQDSEHNQEMANAFSKVATAIKSVAEAIQLLAIAVVISGLWQCTGSSMSG